MRFIKLLSLIGAIALLGLITACGGDTPEREPQATEIQVSDMGTLSRAVMQINREDGNFEVIFVGTWNINTGNRTVLARTFNDFNNNPRVAFRAEPGMSFNATELTIITATQAAIELGGLPLGGNNWVATRANQTAIAANGQGNAVRSLSANDPAIPISNQTQLRDIDTLIRESTGGGVGIIFDQMIPGGRGLLVTEEYAQYVLNALRLDVTNARIAAGARRVPLTTAQTDLLRLAEIAGGEFNNGNLFELPHGYDISTIDLNGQRLATNTPISLNQHPTALNYWVPQVAKFDGEIDARKLLPLAPLARYDHSIEIQTKTQGVRPHLIYLCNASADVIRTPASPNPNGVATFSTDPYVGRHIPIGQAATAPDFEGTSTLGGWTMNAWNLKQAGHRAGHRTLLNTTSTLPDVPTGLNFSLPPNQYLSLATAERMGAQLVHFYQLCYRGLRFGHVVGREGQIVTIAVPDDMVEPCTVTGGITFASQVQIINRITSSGWFVGGLRIVQASRANPENII